MKFVLAPDKFKGSLTGFEVCNAIEKGIKQVFEDAEILKIPLADGGDGTIEVVRHHLNAQLKKIKVNNPFFKQVEASYLFSHRLKTAYIEMAEASGLKLLKENEKNVTSATSFGTGELILDAVKNGAKEIILGIGGSATNDAGMGMAAALGFAFLDKNNKPLLPIGSNLVDVRKIAWSGAEERFEHIKVKVACDVTNPFYGPEGAAYVYAEQKGATLKDIYILDNGLRNFAQVIEEEYGIAVQEIPGAGAAGGMGGGSSVFLGATLTSGIELIKEMADFDAQIVNADWIITGEGKLDRQTLSGKTINGVIKSAQKRNIPVAAFCGEIDLSDPHAKNLGISYRNAISKDMPNLEKAIEHSFSNLESAAKAFAKNLR